VESVDVEIIYRSEWSVDKVCVSALESA